MKKHSLTALLAASALLSVGVFSGVQHFAYAAEAIEKFAPTGYVESFNASVGDSDPGETNLICKPISLNDKDTPVENLRVSMLGSYEATVILREKERQLCVNTSKAFPLSTVRFQVTDGEHSTLFENTIYIRELENTAPQIEVADVNAVLNETEGKKCVPITLADKEDAADSLVVTVETNNKAVTVENNQLCVNTSKPVAPTPVTVKVADSGNLEATATATVKVLAPPKLSVEPFHEKVGEGTVCHAIKVVDEDSKPVDIKIQPKSKFPAGVSLEANSVCVDRSQTIPLTKLKLSATDETMLSMTIEVEVEVKSGPAPDAGAPAPVPAPGVDVPVPAPGTDVAPVPAPAPGTDVPTTGPQEKKPEVATSKLDTPAQKELPKTGIAGGFLAVFSALLLAVGATLLTWRQQQI